MRNLILVFAVCLITAGAVSAGITLPPVTDTTLANGLTVQVVERHSLPLFSYAFIFRAGSVCDPADREGLAYLSSDMLMRGTDRRSAKEIAEAIAFVGATLSSFCDMETVGMQGESLAEYGETVFSIAAEVLMNSAFAEDEFDKSKNLQISGLISMRDNAGSAADMEIVRELLSPGPYAHMPKGSIAGVERLTRADAVEFAGKYFTPDNCLLVVCGDVDRQTVIGWAEKYLGNWQGRAGGTSFDKTGQFPTCDDRGVLILDKPDATQTQIRMGLIGMPKGDTEYIPFELARTMYAGSFTSRLVNEIRVNRGLSYNVRCRSYNYSRGGIIYVSTFTKNESVGEVIDIILAESKRMQNEPVPDSELTGTQNYRCGLYPLRFETNDDLAEVFADIWLYNLDHSYFQDFQEKTRKVDQDQVIRAAEKYFPLERYRLVLVGKADEIRSQAEKYGPVTVRSITSQ